MKTYYQILGVLDDAEEVVIRAAYKALAQKYHPDKWKGSKEEATAKMAEINQAYEVLVDPIKRARYDETIDKNRYEDESEANEEELIKDLDASWNKVLEFLPALGGMADELSKLSKSLEYVFKLTLLETKKFSESETIAANLERSFLTKYFGSNKSIQLFAKELILEGDRKAAKSLNEAVVLLGSDVDPNIIIRKIKGESVESNQRIFVKKLAQDLIDIKSYRTAEEFMQWMGGTIKDVGFWGSSVELTYGGRTQTFSLNEFIEYATNVATEFLRK